VHPANWGHDWHSFAPFGFAGIGSAAGYIFFAYIGFDAVSTTAQEARNPQRDLPIGIITSLVICTVLYVSVAAVLTGMVPWQLVNIGAPLTHAFLDHEIGWASDIITCGALAGLTSVMLVMLIGQTRVLYAMASDGLLPKKFFGAIHPRFHTPWKNTILVGLLAASVGSITPIDKIGKMVNIGTLLAFVMVCASIIVLRIKSPDQHRPFRTPGIYLRGRLPVVPALGIIANGYLMYSLGWENWARLFIWLAIGLVVYFSYSVHHSRVRKQGKVKADVASTKSEAVPDGTIGASASQPVIVVASTKSMGLAIVLALLFGPLGLLYSSVLAAVVMFVVSIVVAIFTMGIGLLFTNPICAIWAGVAVNTHNKKLLGISQP